MYVFVIVSDQTSGMAMSGSTADYYTEAYCISKVRAKFNLAPEFPVYHVPQNLWNGPIPTPNRPAYAIKASVVFELEIKYLVEECKIEKSVAARAVIQAESMYFDKLGMYWSCVKIA